MERTYATVFAPQLAFLGSLDATSIAAIKNYTSSDYYEHLNRQLCAGLPLSGIYNQIYTDMMHIFERCPKLKQPVVVWRGIRAKELVVGRLACQFVSTSLSLESAMREEFTGSACCVLKITLPSGTQVLPVEHIAEQAGEWEVILPPNGTWSVLSVEEVPYPSRTSWVTTYDLTYLPKERVTLTQTTPEETKRQLLQLTHNENILRIVKMYDPEELDLVYDGNVDTYLTDIAQHIGALPMPPLEAIRAQLPS